LALLLSSNLLLWLAFALLTGVVVWLLLSPFKASRAGAGASRNRAEEVALYRDQLAEVTRDVERGVMGEGEAEAARIEVSRRLLAATDASHDAGAKPAPRNSRRAAFAMMLFVPASSLALYLALGSPDVPDAPFAPRIEGPAAALPLDALIIKVEQHLKETPDDLAGWEVVAPAYLRQRNFPAAISAWNRAIALGGETAGRLAARGEAQVFAADGSLTQGARDDFTRAVAMDSTEPRAQYYLGLADIEDGAKDKAIARWTNLIDGAAPDAPWRASMEAELAALKAPGPSAAQMDAASNMSAGDRQQMIEGMVAGLAARLEETPDDLAGWQRLIRAYGVLGKTAEQSAALAKARKVFAGNADALTALSAAASAPAPQ
tara:strand:+ start:3572 stop:4699 length:1128 start_codon:yes stop_codon:yes gene_type:complete